MSGFDIEQVKRWHWIVIGLLLGLSLGYAYAASEADGFTRGRTQISPMNFEQALHQRPKQGKPWLTDIVVYPRRDGQLVQMNMLTNEDKTNSGPGEWVYRPYEMYAPKPYKPYMTPQGRWPWRNNAQRQAPSPDYTVLSYLQDVAKNNNRMSFRYGWWKEPRVTGALWTLGSVVVVGGIWPTVLKLLIGAGFGRKKEPEAEYDLDRFKSEEAAKAPVASAADDTKLRSRVEEIEQELMSNLRTAQAGGADQEGETAAPIRTLSAGPLAGGTIGAAPEKDRNYKGEFYPVAHPSTKRAGDGGTKTPRGQ